MRTISSARSTLSFTSADEYLWARATRSGNATFSNTVMCGQIAYDWNTMPSARLLAGTLTRLSVPGPAANNTLPPTDTTPESGRSRPAIDRSVVDFPQPDGP